MKKILNKVQSNTFFIGFSIVTILLVAIVPLFFNLPFRDNIYLSYEGAYRMYKGQMPFKDFGIPLGYAYWLAPLLSFYVFGPYLFSLVKIQVCINIISGLTFLSLIRRFSKDAGLVAGTIILYVVSFSFYNFWPWYNHTVIVFEFIGLAFLFFSLCNEKLIWWKSTIFLILSALFSFLSFFTKQDGGAFAIFICGLLLIYYSIVAKNWKFIVIYGVSYLLIACAFILPLLKYDFGYWFNYGQSPHYSRISINDFLSVILGESSFIKFYLLLIILVVVAKLNKYGSKFFLIKIEVFHLILTICVLFQASILQVTSYVPVDGNIYYHSFMVFYIISNINLGLVFNRLRTFIPLVLLILLWWSGLYWKYANRMLSKFIDTSKTKEVVSRTTYTSGVDTTMLDKSKWVVLDEESFDRIKVPPETALALDWIKEWYVTQEGEPRILNMSELTPLAEVLGYELEEGMPLWYHLNVGMFDKSLTKITSRIKNDYYDMVIFENIPHLNNFYPFEVREVLMKNYVKVLSFDAPRELKTEVIEVYVKRNEED